MGIYPELKLGAVGNVGTHVLKLIWQKAD